MTGRDLHDTGETRRRDAHATRRVLRSYGLVILIVALFLAVALLVPTVDRPAPTPTPAAEATTR